jgi:hypothetical protein
MLGVVLIGFIRKSRNRLKNAESQNRIKAKDMKFAITSVTLNLLFLFLTVQNPCVNVIRNNSNLFKLLDDDLKSFLSKGSIIIFDS